MVVDYPDWQRGIRLVGADITLNVNIEAQVANLNFNFADQSVAVFDAAKWFAHQAEQVFVTAVLSRNPGASCTVASRTVPGDKTFFVAGMGWGVSGFVVPTLLWSGLYVEGSRIVLKGSIVGDSIIFDVPIRVEAGEGVTQCIGYQGPSATTVVASFWGWDEEV